MPSDAKEEFQKFERSFEIVKRDDDERLVYGWFSVAVTKDGEVVEDLQGDIIEIGDLEKAVHEYVMHSRNAGEMHKKDHVVGTLVESMVFTLEKMDALGIPHGILHQGWFGAFHIHDDAAWEGIKTGIYKMFSVGGRARRVEAP